jgi:hypothetical protein
MNNVNVRIAVFKKAVTAIKKSNLSNQHKIMLKNFISKNFDVAILISVEENVEDELLMSFLNLGSFFS